MTWPVKIAGLGTCLPERRVTSTELEAKLGLQPGWNERVTGVRERRYAGQETSVGMAARATRMALAHGGVAPEDVDLVIGASTAPAQLIPCTAALVQRELGLPEGRSLCFDLDATCLSFLVALHVAAPLVAAGTYRAALVYSSEITSHGLNPAEPESAVLFGDGAAAAVLTRSGPGDTGQIWRTCFETWSGGADLTQCLGGGTLHHPNDPTTTPEMNLFHMNGPAIYRLATRRFAPFLGGFLTDLGWERAEVDAVVPHQASLMGMHVLHARLGFREDQVVSNLALRGNCIAASLPLVLGEAVHEGRVRRGQRLLLLGTGAGLTLGAVALTF
jgi:3-oxoacyl-[acyl-carrier-protein] synthase-3